jgi:hypothetical protein
MRLAEILNAIPPWRLVAPESIIRIRYIMEYNIHIKIRHLCQFVAKSSENEPSHGLAEPIGPWRGRAKALGRSGTLRRPIAGSDDIPVDLDVSERDDGS